MPAKREAGQAIGVGHRTNDDAATRAAIPAIRSTLGNELFSAKAHAAVPAVAPFHKDLGSVDEHFEALQQEGERDRVILPCLMQADETGPRNELGQGAPRNVVPLADRES